MLPKMSDVVQQEPTLEEVIMTVKAPLTRDQLPEEFRKPCYACLEDASTSAGQERLNNCILITRIIENSKCGIRVLAPPSPPPHPPSGAAEEVLGAVASHPTEDLPKFSVIYVDWYIVVLLLPRE